MNAYGRSAQEQRAFENLLYPETLDSERTDGVLINKFGLRDPQLLEVAERTASHDRLMEGLPPQAREISVDGIKAIHRHLLQDVYDWAGSFRNYTTGRGTSKDASFARPEFIESNLVTLIDKLKGEQLLHGLDPRSMASRSAHYVNELNAIHPFVDGNGRMQRTWLRTVCEQAGYHVEFRPRDRDAWNAASAHGFYKSDDKMTAFLLDRLQPSRTKRRVHEQETNPSQDRVSKLRAQYLNRLEKRSAGSSQGDNTGRDRDEGHER